VGRRAVVWGVLVLKVCIRSGVRVRVKGPGGEKDVEDGG
jgi:hypothetical protein